MKNLIFGNSGASNLSRTEAFENQTRGPITQGECVGGHNTCHRFVEKRSFKLCLHHRHQSLRAEIKFQQLVLEHFLNRLCRQSLKENKFWREFEAKKEV